MAKFVAISFPYEELKSRIESIEANRELAISMGLISVSTKGRTFLNMQMFPDDKSVYSDYRITMKNHVKNAEQPKYITMGVGRIKGSDDSNPSSSSNNEENKAF